jgi:hypothetical protein
MEGPTARLVLSPSPPKKKNAVNPSWRRFDRVLPPPIVQVNAGKGYDPVLQLSDGTQRKVSGLPACLLFEAGGRGGCELRLHLV